MAACYMKCWLVGRRFLEMTSATYWQLSCGQNRCGPPCLLIYIQEFMISSNDALPKERHNRWRDIGDVRFELQRASTQIEDASTEPVANVQPPASARQPLKSIAMTFCITAMLAGAIAWIVWPRRPVSPLTRFGISLPPDSFVSGIGLSPDGRRVGFISNGQLYVRSLDSLRTVPVAGTEGAAEGPFFSPDGDWLAFFTANQLKKVALNGGAAIPIASVEIGLTGSWTSDGRIIFGVGGPTGLFQVPATGGKPESLIKLEGYNDLDYPEMLPGTEWVLYTANTSVGNQFDIVAQSLRTGEKRVVIHGGKFGKYSPTGHVVYEQLGSLYAVPFDSKKLTITGSPTALGEHVATDLSFFSPALF